MKMTNSNFFIRAGTVIAFLGVLLYGAFYSTGALSATGDYWMPRHTLTNDLNVYEGPSSTDYSVIFTVPKNTPLREEASSTDYPKWLRVSFSGGEGYVYKPSVDAYDTPLNYLQKTFANELVFYRVGGAFYFLVAEWCYIVLDSQIRAVPQGPENKQTLKQYLDKNGGIPSLTDEQRINCGFE